MKQAYKKQKHIKTQNAKKTNTEKNTDKTATKTIMAHRKHTTKIRERTKQI